MGEEMYGGCQTKRYARDLEGLCKKTVRHVFTLIDTPQTVVKRRNSHFRSYCGGIFRRKRFILFENNKQYLKVNGTY